MKAWATPRTLAFVLYGLAALLIMAPLLSPGFVLTLDMVFTPHMPLPEPTRASFPLYALLHYLGFVIPADILQKIMLIAIFVLSGFGAYRLVEKQVNTRPEAAYFAGLLYMINPFVYDRLMAGQFAVLMGYALLPLFVQSLVALVRTPSARQGVYVGMWLVAIGIVSIHTLGLAVVIALPVGVWALWRYKTKRRALLLHTATMFGVFIVVSSYWLVPLALGQGQTAQTLQNIGSDDRAAFATAGQGVVGKIGNVVRLQGFWAEPYALFMLPQDQLPGWGLVAIAILLLAVAGAVWAWRHKHRFIVGALSVSALMALCIALGVGSEWLAVHIPFFAGFREPQKFVAIIALAYAVLAGIGVAALFDKLRSKPFAASLTYGVFLLPILYAPTLLWGGVGQLAARSYPPDWAQVKQIIQKDSDTQKVLFLPWHLYMDFDFAKRIIMNPAPTYFGTYIISSDDPEFGNVPPMGNTASAYIQNQVLPNAAKRTDMGALLAKQNIGYVILAKEFDYATYEYLNNQTDLRLVQDSHTMRLYKNTALKKED